MLISSNFISFMCSVVSWFRFLKKKAEYKAVLKEFCFDPVVHYGWMAGWIVKWTDRWADTQTDELAVVQTDYELRQMNHFFSVALSLAQNKVNWKTLDFAMDVAWKVDSIICRSCIWRHNRFFPSRFAPFFYDFPAHCTSACYLEKGMTEKLRQ